jgi:2-keto-4-pentenoate hydratase/2-oxohepta-3-ene-1,7-dioic acid hydratase in catechol pathway
MRIANMAGRAKLIAGEKLAVDVESVSNGRFGPEMRSLYDEWPAFREWASGRDLGDGAADRATEPFSAALAGPPSPTPRQVFAVALNYRDHASESGFEAPADPLFFPKWVSSFSGPVTEVVLPEGKVDWECELVAVISQVAHRVSRAEGWSYVAGLTVGNDISERALQRSGPAPQYGLAKSFPGFAPSGPVLVTPDEFDDPDDLAISCEVNDQVMQSARTTDMIFPVAALVAYLSEVVTLYPGDVIFTGTPPGVGMGRDPQVFLKPGDRLRSRIEGIGELHQTFVAGD